MEKTNYKDLMIEHWVPTLVTGLFGIIIGLSVTLFKAEVSDNRFFLEKQSSTADNVASEFSIYVENWRRIIKLKQYVIESKRNPKKQEIQRLRVYVAHRDKARDKLFSALDSLSLYFDESTSNIASDFKKWDELQSTKTVADLPNLSEWKQIQMNILKAMKKELKR